MSDLVRASGGVVWRDGADGDEVLRDRAASAVKQRPRILVGDDRPAIHHQHAIGQ